MYRLSALVLVIICLCACNKGGTVDNAVPELDLGAAADGNDDTAIADSLNGDIQANPDGQTITDVTDTSAADTADQAGLPDSSDAVGSDIVDDSADSADDAVEGEIIPFQPFAGCTNVTACPHPQEPLCLLLPNSDEGICVKPCGGDEGGCAPWLECVQPDSGNPDLQVCLDIADLGESCSVTDGIVCKPGTFCVATEGTGVCTTFCTPGESVCPAGTTCTLVDPADESWGACLASPDLPQCEEAGDCLEDEVCAELVPELLSCVPTCPEAGAGCGSFGLCTATVKADGEPGNACVTYQEQGQICDAAKGLFCLEELKCVDLQAPDGWSRCLKDCFGGQCEPGYACKQPEGAPKEFCLPLAMTLPDPTFCNETYPCPDGWQVCTQGEGDATGICAPPCAEDGGCPIGQGCHNGGCVPAVPLGAPCLAAKGLFCQDEALCLADKGQTDEAGYCATPCVEGDNGECAGLTTCQPAGEGLFACLVAGQWGEPCSLDEGTSCDSTKGLQCLHISADDDNGFCTGTCEGPGTCPQEVEAAYAECMIQKAGVWYCAFICGGLGATCPDGMSCSGFGMCAP